MSSRSYPARLPRRWQIGIDNNQYPPQLVVSGSKFARYPVEVMPVSEHEVLRKAANALMGSWMAGSGTADQAELYAALDQALGNKEQG